jgi:superfamily II DNA or RNA helicase
MSEIRGAYAIGNRCVLYVLPTGGGKTVTFSMITAGASAKGNETWIVAHRRELVNQASKTLGKFGVPHGFILSGVAPSPLETTHVCSLQTLIGKMGKIKPPDFIIFDESHHATSGSYQKIMKAYPSAKILGVTATPCRTDGKGLGDVFQSMIVGPATSDLTNNGYLSSARYYCTPCLADLGGIKKRGGDYVREDLAEAMDQRAITGDAIEHYKRICDGVPMIVFCVSVQHAKDVASAYLTAGYRATFVDGSLDEEDRTERLEGLGNGKYQIVTSCDLIGEGLDIPNVVAAQLLRPTESTSLHLQQIGRPLRPVYAPGHLLHTAEDRLNAIAAGGKPCAYILDHVGNCGANNKGGWETKHGFAVTPREWTLKGKVKRGKSEADVSIKSCPDCFSVHEPAGVCPFCGHVYEVVRARKIESVKGELVEVTPEMMTARKAEDRRAHSKAELIAIGKARGYKNPEYWAMMKMKGRQRR